MSASAVLMKTAAATVRDADKAEAATDIAMIVLIGRGRYNSVPRKSSAATEK
ncbi:MAG: hypothetical protein WKF30_01270 [Pyrinomonadaceae bacterium]